MFAGISNFHVNAVFGLSLFIYSSAVSTSPLELTGTSLSHVSTVEEYVSSVLPSIVIMSVSTSEGFI